MRVIVHIGSTKTGSSALQATLFERRDALAAAGVHYSAAGVAAGAHHLLAASIHPGAWRMHADALPEDRAGFFEDTVATIKSDAAAAGAHTIVISSEYFWGTFPSRLYKTFAQSFSPATFEVVAFIRQPDDWVASSYLQALKSGEARPFGDWFAHVMGKWGSGIHYFRVINRWNAFLDAHAVHVLRYEDTKANVYKAFCDTLGIDVDTDLKMRAVNPSPSAQSVEQLLAVNRSDLSAEAKAAQRKAIMLSQRGPPSLRDVMDEVQRTEILTLTQQSDRLLAQAFLSVSPPPPQPHRTT